MQDLLDLRVTPEPPEPLDLRDRKVCPQSRLQEVTFSCRRAAQQQLATPSSAASLKWCGRLAESTIKKSTSVSIARTNLRTPRPPENSGGLFYCSGIPLDSRNLGIGDYKFLQRAQRTQR